MCGGGTLMPEPQHGYWVDRSNLKYANFIYQCLRKTCVPEPSRFHRSLNDADPSSCWDQSAYGTPTSQSQNQDEPCNSDELLCKAGSRGPLCGSCVDDFIYSSAGKVCVACSDPQTWVLALAVISVFFFGVALWTFFSTSTTTVWWLDGKSLLAECSFRVLWANYQVTPTKVVNQTTIITACFVLSIRLFKACHGALTSHSRLPSTTYWAFSEYSRLTFSRWSACFQTRTNFLRYFCGLLRRLWLQSSSFLFTSFDRGSMAN
jgi:hypothetical protein